MELIKYEKQYSKIVKQNELIKKKENKQNKKR